MKIAINARVLNERQGGPARVTLNFIKELSKIDDHRFIKVTYKELTENPGTVIDAIKDKISNHLKIDLEIRDGLPDKFPFRTYNKADKQEFSNLMNNMV